MLASSGNEIKIWNLDPFHLIKEYQPNRSNNGLQPISWFSIRPDGNQIASILKTDCINLFNLDTQTQDYFKDTSNEVTCCSFDSSGRFLAVGTANCHLDLIDFNSHSMKKRNWKATAPITCLCWNKNDRYIALGSSNGSITLFNTLLSTMAKPIMLGSSIQTSNSSLKSQNGGSTASSSSSSLTSSKQMAITAIQYSLITSTQIGCSYDDGTVAVWDMNKEKPLCVLKEHKLPCTSLAFSPINNMLMVSGGLDGLCCVDLPTKKLIKSISVPGGITSLDMQSNGINIWVGTASGHLNMYDLRYISYEPKLSERIHDTSVHYIKSFSTNSSLIAHSNSHSSSMNQTPDTSSRVNHTNQFLKKSSSTNFDPSSHSSTNFGPPAYNIFSPDVPYSHSHSSSSSRLTTTTTNPVLQSTALQYTHGDSTISNGNNETSTKNGGFILHKKQTSNGGSSNHLNGARNLNEGATPTNINETLPNRGNLLRNDMFSPISNNVMTPLSQTVGEEVSLIAQFAQLKQQKSANLEHHKHRVVSPSASFTNAAALKSSLSPRSSTCSLLKQPESHVQAASKTPSTNQTVPTNSALTSSFQLKQLEETLSDKIDDFRDELMSENFRFKAEMFQEFIELKKEIIRSMEACSINETLVAEILKLREENKRLKKLF